MANLTYANGPQAGQNYSSNALAMRIHTFDTEINNFNNFNIMKKVFTNSEIMHVFNLQEQTHARTTNNNIFMEYNKIYSYGYHYLLAEFIDEKTVFINDRGYSNSNS